MWIESLSLSDFRNFHRQELSFDKKINLFVGDNAQGKTNIVEALHLLSTTKSFRTNLEADLISWSAEKAKVSGVVGSSEIKILLSREYKKTLVNSREKNKSFLIGLFPAVLFSPESLTITSGPPEKRRRFLDQILSTTNKNYLFSLSRYFKVVKARNRLLWLSKEGRNQNLEPWDKQLIDLGSFIWWQRLSFVHDANALLKKIGPKLIGAEIRVLYKPFPERLPDLKEIKKFMEGQLPKHARGDLEKGVTSFGPHRDDFRILFELFGEDRFVEKDVCTFGSRGEERIATLALKLVEVDFIEKNLGERPALLLDDVLSEFDKKNREQILKTLPKQQSIITATSVDLMPRELVENVKIFEVSKGTVTEK